MRRGRVEITNGFLILWAWMMYRDSTGFVPQLMLACVLHELGHIVALGCFQQRIRHIKLTVFGVQIRFENTLSYWGEFIAALAGPGMNLLLCSCACKFPQASVFAGVNLALALFNLFPVGHLDGRRCLNSFLYMILPACIADGISKWITDIFATVFLLLGILLAVFGANYSLILMWIWVVKGHINENMTKLKKK